MSGRTIAVIDGNSLMHRAYHAVQTPMNTPDGTPTNAVFGFMSMLLKFNATAHPDGIVCAFDAGKPTFRIEAMERYKAQRPHMDDELRVQFPLVEGLLSAMNIPVVKVAGWEGDDILGTVAARCEAAGDKALLVTGDKDACQLVTESTHVVNTKKGITDVVVYDPAGVEERYGVRPSQIPDYLGLMGDSSDNIPGVPGVGAKTAARFLREYGSIEGLYEHADEVGGKLGEKVRANRELAFLSRKVATIVRDLDFELDLGAVRFPDFDPAEVVRAFGALHFTRHMKNVLALQDGAGTGQEAGMQAVSDVRLSYHVARDARKYLDAAVAGGAWVAVGIDEPAETSLFGDGAMFVASDGAGLAQLPLEEAWPALENLLAHGKVAGFDVKGTVRRAAYAAQKTGDELCALLGREDLPARLFDVGVAAYLLDSEGAKDPADIVAGKLGLRPPVGDGAPGEGRFLVAAAAALVDLLQAQLEREGALSLFTDIEMPLLPVLAGMEAVGVLVDTEVLGAISSQVGSQVEELRAEIFDLAGAKFNVDSPKQLGEVLFERLGLDRRKSKKTQRGYSTSAAVLDKLRDDHPIAEKVISYRELAKLKSTYLDALPALVDARDGRIHTTFNQTVAATGRLSSSDPNLQNIPVRTELGRHIREAFVAPEGCAFVSADYSQIELRLLAHLSGDAGLVEAFGQGEDFHAHTAAQVFGVPVSQVTPQMRTRAKSVNFGIVYGQGAFGLSQNLHVGVQEAKEMIERYYEAYPRVRAYLDETVERARETGYAETMFGRRRHIPQLASSNHQLRAFGERTAMNHPMQGSAADIIKLAMVEVARGLREEGLHARMVVQVHDELDFECPSDELAALESMVKDAMENVAQLKVPLVVDVQGADNWARAH